MESNEYINSLESANRITEHGIRDAIRFLDLPENSNVLDIPSGIGNHAI